MRILTTIISVLLISAAVGQNAGQVKPIPAKDKQPETLTHSEITYRLGARGDVKGLIDFYLGASHRTDIDAAISTLVEELAPKGYLLKSVPEGGSILIGAQRYNLGKYDTAHHMVTSDGNIRLDIVIYPSGERFKANLNQRFTGSGSFADPSKSWWTFHTHKSSKDNAVAAYFRSKSQLVNIGVSLPFAIENVSSLSQSDLQCINSRIDTLYDVTRSVVRHLVSEDELMMMPPKPEKEKTALTKEERIFGLVTIYGAAKQHFAMFEQVSELDWDKTFMEYLPLVEKEQSLLEYYQTLRRFTVLLQDGHTFVSLPDSINLTQMGNLPVNLDYIEEQWVVIERLPTEEILTEDIPPGAVVLNIQGLPAKDYIEKKVFPFVPGGTFQGKSGLMNKFRLFPAAEPIQLILRYPDGSIHTRSLYPTSKNNRIKWRDLEHINTWCWPWHQMERFETRTLEDNILYIRYGTCTKGMDDKIAELVKTMKTPIPKAMVLDLRGNVGGSTPIKTVRHLISKPVKIFFFKTPCSISYVDARMQGGRSGQSKQEIVNDIFDDFPEYSPGWYSFSSIDIEPEKNYYDGPIVILTDRMTSSAAEDLVVILQGNNRAKVIGEPTHGSTGQPIYFDLPGGGRVRICTCLSQYPDGRNLTGVGAQPDILVKRTIQAIAEGRDEVLEATINYLQSLKDDNQVNIEKSQNFLDVRALRTG